MPTEDNNNTVVGLTYPTTDEPKKEPPRKPKTFAEILESIRYYANRR